TIRYYERIGVLPKAARTKSGYRQYPESSLVRISIVRNAVRYGFSLKQVAHFIHARDHGRAPCREVRAAGEEILAEVNRGIAAFRRIRMDSSLFHIDPVTIVVLIIGFGRSWYSQRSDVKIATSWIKHHQEECEELRKANNEILSELRETNARLTAL